MVERKENTLKLFGFLMRLLFKCGLKISIYFIII